ncbi:hypothetical protein GH714_018770 [Hevea brasiliensis]|uniref:Aspartic peptidase DDI1-type domain-containing protein n=1 Tax=Hevea brasiliensis TaxID=3981 RepID=A0A6A6LTC2_HEVBR|nr:hypothetical protein GH714_018770 [Hevea brasiliensis]
MMKSATHIDALEKKVEEIFTWIDECPNYKELITELESVHLALVHRDKRIEVLYEKIEHLLVVVAKLSNGTMDDIKNDVKEAVNMIQGELQELKDKVNLLVRAASNPHMGAYEVKNELMRRNVKELSVALGINNIVATKPRSLKYFLCDGPHRVPHKVALHALRAIWEEKGPKEEQGMEENDPLMGSALRFLRALEKQKPKENAKRGLMYVDLCINGKATRALIDTGATNNFVVDKMASRFKLNIQEDVGKIKAVNSKALNTVGIARRASCQMGPWKVEINFTVSPLDDFDVVISMEFLKQARAIPILATDYLILMGNKLCVVPITLGTNRV